MANGDNARVVFPLTSLQIGDLQSYLSHLSLFVAYESGKLYILVDNRPWLEDLVSQYAHLWQLMVMKSRLSPFAITRRKKERKMIGELSELQASSSNTKKQGILKKWFSVIDAVNSSRNRALLPVKKLRNSLFVNSKLRRTLYGFIIFEVAWKDVRGIHYLNELQTDTSIAIESKFMRRWEFDSTIQASRCISTWYPGTLNEKNLLNEHLNATSGEEFHDVEESFPSTTETNVDDTVCDDFSFYPVTVGTSTNEPHTPPSDGSNKRREVMRPLNFDAEFESGSGEDDSESVEILSQGSDSSDCEDTLEPKLYRDVLISFRFNDRDLPFKLKGIIMSNLRLLTLLEAGLPSWVIFLQSYPVFCHIYRPWMCPLARYVYIAISFATVLIGFYDLYKNIPLLKETLSHVFGPLFDWIETWEMITRIKYLGTMLFLHNFRKAIKWLLMVTRTARSFISFFIEPMAGPFAEFLDFFMPFANMCIQLVDSTFSVTYMVFESSATMVIELVQIILLPIWYVLLLVWNIAISVIYPIIWILGEILYSPFRLVLGLWNLVAFLCTSLYELVRDIWIFASGLLQFTRSVESTTRSYEVSMWRSLWNDLFSQVFRALRSILNGFVVFFTACNRHRLSIYNYLKEFIQRYSRSATRTRISKRGGSVGTPEPQITRTKSVQIR